MKFNNKHKLTIFVVGIILLIMWCLVSIQINVISGVVDYQVKSGDTMWSIADNFSPDSMDKREYLYDMKKINNDVVDIQTGQRIFLPVITEVNAMSYVNHTSLGVPNINSSFKTYMDYRCITNKNSNQYKFIHTYGWVDEHGFMRCSGESDFGINDDYYLIALGSYYGKTIGDKYKITTDNGTVFYGALADCKSNSHTNSTNQYSKNNDVVEFIVDTKTLNKNVKYHGSANVHMPLNGSIAKIEKLNFVFD